MSFFIKQPNSTSKNRKIVYTVSLVFVSPFIVLLPLLFIPYVWGYKLNIGGNKDNKDHHKVTLLESDVRSKFNNLKQNKTFNILLGIMLMMAGNPRAYNYTLNATQAVFIWLSVLFGIIIFIRGLGIKSK